MLDTGGTEEFVAVRAAMGGALLRMARAKQFTRMPAYRAEPHGWAAATRPKAGAGLAEGHPTMCAAIGGACLRVVGTNEDALLRANRAKLQHLAPAPPKLPDTGVTEYLMADGTLMRGPAAAV